MIKSNNLVQLGVIFSNLHNNKKIDLRFLKIRIVKVLVNS